MPYYDYALDLILDVESPSDDMLTVGDAPAPELPAHEC